jgi:hypothetical protein
MRLQLIRLAAALALVAAAFLPARSARADDRIEVRSNLFHETGNNGSRVTSITPQIAISKDLSKYVTLSVGYEADIVSGATPQVFRVDATTGPSPFSDIRHSPKAGLTLRSGNVQVSAGYAYSIEHDYRSNVISLGGQVELFGKNTTIGVSYSHNIDSVCDATNQAAGNDLLRRRALAGSELCFTDNPAVTARPLDIDSFELTVAQIVTPTLLLQVGGAMQVLRGLQSSPYREVQLQFQTAQEHVPDVRYRAAGFARAAIYLSPLRASIQMFARYYRDSWDIQAATGEFLYSHYLGNHFLVRGRFRFYRQSGAVFYRDADLYAERGPVGQYFTGDRELSPFQTFLGGGRISYLTAAGEKGKLLGLFHGIELALRGDYTAYQPLTPLPPNRDRRFNLVAGIGLDLAY